MAVKASDVLEEEALHQSSMEYGFFDQETPFVLPEPLTEETWLCRARKSGRNQIPK